MTIIEADGIETEPLVVDSLTIYAAQRYSVVVNADQPVDNYCTWSISIRGSADFTKHDYL